MARGLVLGFIFSSSIILAHSDHPEMPKNSQSDSTQAVEDQNRSEKSMEAKQSDSSRSANPIQSDHIQPSMEGLIDLERILESDAQLEEAYVDLSPEERDALVQAIEQLNEAFKEALIEVLHASSAEPA